MEKITLKIKTTNHKESREYLSTNLHEIINNTTDCDNILTNGNLASVLQDDLLYKLKTNLNLDKKIYSIGLYDKLILNVDIYQKWTDNTIFLRKNKNIVYEIFIEDENEMLI